MNILVVDDEESLLLLVGRMLEGLGHRAFTTSDAERAIETIAREQIDLLIADVEMPGATGPQLALIARQLRSKIAVLYMSGSAQTVGAPLLLKPFQRQGLLNGIHQALAWSRSRAVPGLSWARSASTSDELEPQGSES